MRVAYLRKLREKIDELTEVTLFSPTTFQDVADIKIIERDLLRLLDEGLIHRVVNGLYFNVMRIDNEIVYPSLNDVALAISKKFGWDIRPNSEASLYILGLTDTMPTDYIYISNGPYREFNVFNKVLKFNHVANREINHVSYDTSLFIQALKGIGVNNITDEILEKLASQVKDPKTLLSETELTAHWIRKAIKDIVLKIK